MSRKIALATITAAPFLAPPSLVHAGVRLTNGVSINGQNRIRLAIPKHDESRAIPRVLRAVSGKEGKAGAR